MTRKIILGRAGIVPFLEAPHILLVESLGRRGIEEGEVDALRCRFCLVEGL
jgi:hypothetical protein